MFRTLTLWAALLLALVPLSAQAQTLSEKPKLTTLHRFGGDSDGAEPATTLTLGTDGNFYGVTFGTATVFKLTPSGQFTTLHTFRSAEGAETLGALTKGKDGAFYGTAEFGGAQNYGTVYRITPDGQFTVLHSFTFTDGNLPRSPLLLGPDGSFYGTTASGGGAKGYGTVFHMTTDGTVTTLHAFSSDSSFPDGRLVLGPDGALYGTTVEGGKHNYGTVYRLATDGSAFSVLHLFTGSGGARPYAGLTAGPEGALYGATFGGGIGQHGVVYKITASGVFTTLHKFNLTDEHGARSYAALTLGADGNFYGTTTLGGTNGMSTVFQMTPQGQVTTLYKFHTKFDGNEAFGGVAFGTNGLLYGTTGFGGAKGGGTIFSLSVPAAN